MKTRSSHLREQNLWRQMRSCLPPSEDGIESGHLENRLVEVSYVPELAMLQITVKTDISGYDLRFDISSSSSVLEVKQKIQESLGIPVDMQVLAYSGRLLENSDSLEQCGMVERPIIRLSLCCRQRPDHIAVFVGCNQVIHCLTTTLGRTRKYSSFVAVFHPYFHKDSNW